MSFDRHPGRFRSTRRATRGSVLIEFALVSLAFYLLIAAVMSFGMQLNTAQVAQDAARVGARELALTPLPAGFSFDDAMADDRVRTAVYDPDALVINLGDLDLGTGPLSLDEYFAELPAVNRALRPLMIHDVIHSSNTGNIRVLRVPGAVVRSTTPSALRKPWWCGFSVAVPRVLGRDAEGHETIEWTQVLSEVHGEGVAGPFSVLAPGLDKGLVALRVNVPVQSSAMAAFKQSANPFDPNAGAPIVANDGGVIQINGLAPGATPVGIKDVARPMNDGRFGMGRVYALGKELRPYRRLITAQAFFRREVFAEQSQ